MIQSDPDTKTNASMILSWSQLVPVQHKLRLQHRLQQVADNLRGLRRGRQYNPGRAQRGELGRADGGSRADGLLEHPLLCGCGFHLHLLGCAMAQTHGYTGRTQEAIRRQGWGRGGRERGGVLYGCSQMHYSFVESSKLLGK